MHTKFPCSSTQVPGSAQCDKIYTLNTLLVIWIKTSDKCVNVMHFSNQSFLTLCQNHAVTARQRKYLRMMYINMLC